MSIVIFIIGIIVLIVVHEFGHFAAAKLSRMRVDEFGLGYPPRVKVFGKIGDTILSLNWLPFGGFVKIFGENLEEESNKSPRAFFSKSRPLQALVLISGIIMNFLFAYVLITAALVVGTPRALEPDKIAVAKDVSLAVTGVLSGSPADSAGLTKGDLIISAEDGHFVFSGVDPEAFTKFVADGKGNTTIALSIKSADGKEKTIFARPIRGLISSDLTRPVLGVEVAVVGIVPLSFPEAVVEGGALTWGAIRLTAEGFWRFFADIFTFSADLSQIAGPVGIAGAVGAASMEGWGSLLSIMAIISINLAFINLIPVPALDGGRLLFVIIESAIRRPIKSTIARAINAVGFALLVLLMLIITAHDIFKILG